MNLVLECIACAVFVVGLVVVGMFLYIVYFCFLSTEAFRGRKQRKQRRHFDHVYEMEMEINQNLIQDGDNRCNAQLTTPYKWQNRISKYYDDMETSNDWTDTHES